MGRIVRKIFKSNVLDCEVFNVIEHLTHENSPFIYHGHVILDQKNRCAHFYDENGNYVCSEKNLKIGMVDHHEIVLKMVNKVYMRRETEEHK